MWNKLIRIPNWDEKFEVNDKGHAWRPGDKKRRGPLDYLRFPVDGSRWPLPYRNFISVAKNNAAMAYGVYVKLQEISAEFEAGNRGAIWVRPGVPASPLDIANLTGFSEGAVEKALKILSDPSVRWIELEPFALDEPAQKQNSVSHTPNMAPLEDFGEPILSITCKPNGAVYRLYRPFLEELIEHYDCLEVLHELDKIVIWSKTARKPWTEKGAENGIRRWLERAMEMPQTGLRPRDDRWNRYQRLFPDWPKEKILWACLTGEEFHDYKKRKIEREEQEQKARERQASKRGASDVVPLSEAIKSGLQGG